MPPVMLTFTCCGVRFGALRLRVKQRALHAPKKLLDHVHVLPMLQVPVHDLLVLPRLRLLRLCGLHIVLANGPVPLRRGAYWMGCASRPFLSLWEGSRVAFMFASISF